MCNKDEMDDYDIRSNSSLSWGEDEFEGEATRMVSKLFEELDELMYENGQKVKVKFPLVNVWLQKRRVNMESCCYKIFLADEKTISCCDEGISDETLTVSDALFQEAQEWTKRFPHLRIRGVGINIQNHDKILSTLTQDCFSQNGSNEEKLNNTEPEEILLCDGDPCNPSMSLDIEDIRDKHSSSSTADPFTLKEQVLVRVFEDIWPSVARTLEPIVNNFMTGLLNAEQIPVVPDKYTKDDVTDLTQTCEKLSLDCHPSTGAYKKKLSLRPQSAMQRIPNNILKFRDGTSSVQSVSYETLNLQKDKEHQTNAIDFKSTLPSNNFLPSLPPSLTSPKTFSSKNMQGFLVPTLTDDQRPFSTSTYNRLRQKTINIPESLAVTNISIQKPQVNTKRPFSTSLHSRMIRNSTLSTPFFSFATTFDKNTPILKEHNSIDNIIPVNLGNNFESKNSVLERIDSTISRSSQNSEISGKSNSSRNSALSESSLNSDGNSYLSKYDTILPSINSNNIVDKSSVFSSRIRTKNVHEL